jgi:CO dehydrogenase maturation factor
MRVLAIDADPNYNLHSSLGIADGELSDIVPLSEMEDLIRERTGGEPYSFGGVFKANPKVSDLPEKLSIIGPDGVRFILMGTVRSAGSGCNCPANILLKNFLRRVLADEMHVIVDMEAGIEHLGRGTAEHADLLLIIVEPSKTSISTARRISKLANDLGIPQAVVPNKVPDGEAEDFIRDNLNGFKLLRAIPNDPSVADAQMRGKALIDIHPDSEAVVAIGSLAERLETMEAST